MTAAVQRINFPAQCPGDGDHKDHADHAMPEPTAFAVRRHRPDPITSEAETDTISAHDLTWPGHWASVQFL